VTDVDADFIDPDDVETCDHGVTFNDECAECYIDAEAEEDDEEIE